MPAKPKPRKVHTAIEWSTGELTRVTRGVNAEKWDTHTFLTEKRPDWKKRFARACRARGTTPSEHLRFLVKVTVQRFERLDPFGPRRPNG